MGCSSSSTAVQVKKVQKIEVPKPDYFQKLSSDAKKHFLLCEDLRNANQLTKGSKEIPDGNYQGEMKDDLAFGWGEVQGKTFKAEGMWKDDKMHGYVVVRERIGGRQEGEKWDGEWHGKVTEYQEDGVYNIMYENGQNKEETEIVKPEDAWFGDGKQINS